MKKIQIELGGPGESSVHVDGEQVGGIWHMCLVACADLDQPQLMVYFIDTPHARSEAEKLKDIPYVQRWVITPVESAGA